MSGQDLVPAAGALGLAALAGLAAVLATRGLARRVVGGLLAAFGVAIAASVSLPVTAAQARSAAVGATTAQAGSVPGGSTVGSGTTPGTGGSGVAGLTLASHVEMAAFPWRWAVLAGGLLVIGAGLLVAWRGARWPVMSSRYDQAGQPEAVRGGGPGQPLGITEPGPRPHRLWFPGRRIRRPRAWPRRRRGLVWGVRPPAEVRALGQEVPPGIPGDTRGALVRLVGRLLVARACGAGPSRAAGARRGPGPGGGELGQA